MSYLHLHGCRNRTVTLCLCLLGGVLMVGCGSSSGRASAANAEPGDTLARSAQQTPIEQPALVGKPDAEPAAARETVVADDQRAVAASPAQFGTDSSAADGSGVLAVAEALVVPQLANTINILVLGSDRRRGFSNWRTDVMMIVSLDLKNGRAGVVSIPRDLFLSKIPGHRPNRINVVDYLGEQDEPGGGGPKLLIRLLEEHMEISIEYYVRFSFSSFKEVVDALGGVDVEMECTFDDGRLRLEQGIQKLDGRQALIFVRSRSTTNDLDRARRQQRFVWAVRNHVRDTNLLPKLPALYGAISNSTETDIGLIRTIQFARFGMRLQPSEITGLVLQPPDMLRSGWQQGMFVFLPDWDAIKLEMTQLFEREPFIITSESEKCS